MLYGRLDILCFIFQLGRVHGKLGDFTNGAFRLIVAALEDQPSRGFRQEKQSSDENKGPD